MTDDATTAPARLRTERSWWRRWLRRLVLVSAAAAITLFGVRVYDTQSGPPLELWHTFVPDELPRSRVESADWAAWMAAEQRAMESVRAEVTTRLAEERRVISNRFYDGSPMHPPKLVRDWNRSYLEHPDGEPQGAVVLLHGLTDSPYSLRHLGRHYRERGFVVVGIRLPAHGTVPAALTKASWEDWDAATRLAVRAAMAEVGDEKPLHLVGFSLGGALATKYTLDAVENDALRTPDRVMLISPMIGITRFARFAGLAGLPSIFPAFAKAAWLGILPEFNPFKYNSFPVNAARQAHRLTVVLQRQILRMGDEGRLGALPPILTFQSVMDFTVSTPAVIAALYAHVPANGSELVLFDINRSIKFDELLRPSAVGSVERLVSLPPRRYDLTIIGNAEGPAGLLGAAVERSAAAGEMDASVRDLQWPYPPQFFSLSHVALPFPLDDALYGIEPNPNEDFGIRLGSLNVRGERGALLVPLDAIFRVASNPFFEYVLARLSGAIADPAPERRDAAHTAGPAETVQQPSRDAYLDHARMPIETP